MQQRILLPKIWVDMYYVTEFIINDFQLANISYYKIHKSYTGLKYIMWVFFRQLIFSKY